MEEAFNRRARSASDASWRIRSTRVARRQIPLLCEGSHRSRIMVHTDRRGEESEIISTLEPGYWGYWAAVENGIYYLDMTAKPGIDFFDFTTHRTTRVFDLENRPASGAPG
jgi:hypothetical protein